MNAGEPLNPAVFAYKLNVNFTNEDEYFETGNIALTKSKHHESKTNIQKLQKSTNPCMYPVIWWRICSRYPFLAILSSAPIDQSFSGRSIQWGFQGNREL